jgi:hypothetical protein
MLHAVAVFVTSLALLLAGQISSSNIGQTPKQPEKPFTLAQVWTLDKTFADQKYGVTFRYPSVWKPTDEFSYHPPALTGADLEIAAFSYDEGGFPRDQIVGPYSGTNLEGVGFLYGAEPDPSAAKCEATAASLSGTTDHSHVVLSGRSFSLYENGEAGMSQFISENLYATYAGDICYVFETDVAGADPDPSDGIPGLTSPQSHFIESRLLDIMKSVRIAPVEYQGKP